MVLDLINGLTGLRLDVNRTWTFIASTSEEIRFGISPDELANPSRSFPLDISVRLCYISPEIEPTPPLRCTDVYFRRKMIGSMTLIPIRKSGRHSRPRVWSLFATPIGYDKESGYFLEVCPDHAYCSPRDIMRVALEDVAIQLASIEDRALRISGNIEFSDLYRAAFDRDVFFLEALPPPCREMISDIEGVYSLCRNCRVAVANYPYMEGVRTNCGPCQVWDDDAGLCVYAPPVCQPGFTPCIDDPCSCCPESEEREEDLPFPPLGPSPLIYGWRTFASCTGDDAAPPSESPWAFQIDGRQFSISSYTPELINVNSWSDEIGDARETDRMYFIPRSGPPNYQYSYTAYHLGTRFRPGVTGDLVRRPDNPDIRDCRCGVRTGTMFAGSCWCRLPQITHYCTLTSELAIGRVIDGVFYPDMSLGGHDRGRPPAPAPDDPPFVADKPCRIVFAEAKVSVKAKIGPIGVKVSYTILRTPPKCTKITGNEVLDELYAMAAKLGFPTGVDLKIASVKTVVQGYCQCK